MLKLPPFDDVVLCSPASQVFDAVLDFVAVFHWQPIISDRFKFFVGCQLFQRHEQVIIIYMWKTSSVIAHLCKHERLLTRVREGGNLFGPHELIVTIQLANWVDEGIERIIDLTIQIEQTCRRVLVILWQVFFFVLTLFVMLLFNRLIDRQQMLVQKRTKLREDHDRIIFFFHWEGLDESIDYNWSEFKQRHLEEAHLWMYHEGFVIVDATHFVGTVHPLGYPWNFV